MSRRGPQIDPTETLRAEIAALPGRKVGKGTKIETDCLPGAYGALIAAAKGRKMSVATYMRRAAYAFAAFDLGIPLTDVLEQDPRAANTTGLPVSDPEGTKFGPWVISSLVGEEKTDVGSDGTAG